MVTPTEEVATGASRPVPDDPQRGFGARFVSELGRPTAATLVWTLVAGVLFAAVGAGAVLAGSSTYESRAVLLIDQPRAIAASGDAGVIQKLSQVRFKYTPLVRTDPVMSRAAETSPVPAGRLRAGAGATAPPLTLTVIATGRSTDADEATAIANAVAAGLVQYVADEQSADGVPPDDQVELTVVSPAMGAAKTDPTDQRVVTATVAVGLAAALTMYLALSAVSARRNGGAGGDRATPPDG